MVRHPALRVCLLSVVVLCATACEKIPKPRTPADPVRIELANPNAEPAQCACSNSQAVYARNTSADPRRLYWTVHTRDTLSNVHLDPIHGDRTIPANGREFIGCTIHAPDTSCRFQASYAKGNSLRLLETPPEMVALYGNETTPSLATCRAWCSDPENPHSGACLELGPMHARAVTPLRDLVLAAQQGDGVVPKQAILDRYGLRESDDKCGRGAITVTDGVVVNEGTDLGDDVCAVHSQGVLAATMHALGLSDTFGTLDTASYLPQRIEGRTVPDNAILGMGGALVFQDNAMAPVIAFGGEGGDELTREFGGAVVGTARFTATGTSPRMIVATTNGCLSIEEP